MSKLISDAYQKLNYELHRTEPAYGANAAKHAPAVADLVVKAAAKTLLDYGCGKGTLKPALKTLSPSLDVREYDPCIPGKSSKPKAADIVTCLDVMEHIEPETLDSVLAHISQLTLHYAAMTISTQPANKTLADGRNAHLTIQPAAWWAETLSRHFVVMELRPFEEGTLLALLRPSKHQ